jgi:peroxiredoxin
MSVIDEFGQTRSLISLWERRKLVLVFTRHMGCRFCKEQISELRKIQPALTKHGISTGVITVGSYKDIPRFKAENMFTGEVYVDTNLFAPECYKVMKLANGMEYLFASDHSKETKEFLPETQEAAIRAASKGFADGGFGTPDSEFTGDTLQVTLPSRRAASNLLT